MPDTDAAAVGGDEHGVVQRGDLGLQPLDVVDYRLVTLLAGRLGDGSVEVDPAGLVVVEDDLLGALHPALGRKEVIGEN